MGWWLVLSWTSQHRQNDFSSKPAFAPSELLLLHCRHVGGPAPKTFYRLFGLISYGWKYCWLIYYKRKILFIMWKRITYKPSASVWAVSVWLAARSSTNTNPKACVGGSSSINTILKHVQAAADKVFTLSRSSPCHTAAVIQWCFHYIDIYS